MYGRLLFIAIMGIGAISLPLRADLITNGSFETPLTRGEGFTDFLSGSAAITGWTVVGPQVSLVSTGYGTGHLTFPSEDGKQWLDLTGDISNRVEGVEQTVATTIGTKYTLSYWVGNVDDPKGTFGTTSSVKVLVDGVLIDTVTNSTASTSLSWERFTDSFTATGKTTIVEFLNNDPVKDNSNGLDNVSLIASGFSSIPEPHTLTLLGIGIIGLSLFQRRAS